MSRRRTSGVHKAAKAPQAGFVRRHLSGFIVLGVVLALAGPTADAADGDPLVLGQHNYAAHATALDTTSFYGFSVASHSDDPGDFGINGSGEAGNGVEGRSTSANGVDGRTSSSTGSGVQGLNPSGGYGVTGRTTGGGVGVWADDADGSGVALRTSGKIQFQKRSNTIVIAPGQKSRTITIPGVTSASRVLATVQRTGGYFVQAVVPGPGSFTIYINKAAAAPQNVPVGYLVIN